MSYIGRHVTVSASLSALRQKGKARSISRTSILTMNNMSATISDTQSYHARVVGTEVASLEEVSAGTTLSIKPRIVFADSPEKRNQFWMTLTLSDGGFESISVDSMPLSHNSSVETQAAVYEGDCILLAGYLHDVEEKAGWGIPYLRDIPFIGWLFGGISKKKETVQRMFILTPYLIDLDVSDIARIQATQQRDISREEAMEDDKKEEDEIRELRDINRQDRDEALKLHYKEMLKKRKAELDFEKEVRESEYNDSRDEWQKELKEKREQWEQHRKAESKDAREQLEQPQKPQPEKQTKRHRP